MIELDRGSATPVDRGPEEKLKCISISRYELYFTLAELQDLEIEFYYSYRQILFASIF